MTKASPELYAKAKSAANVGNWREALESYNAILAVEPGSVEVLEQFAKIARSVGLYAAAIEAFQRLAKVATRAEDKAQAWQSIAITREMNGEVDGAISAMHQSLKIFRSPVLLANLVAILLKAAKLDESLQVLQGALLEFPEYAHLWVLNATTLRRQGKAEEARESISKVKNMSCELLVQQKLNYELGKIEELAGHPEASWKAIEEANRISGYLSKPCTPEQNSTLAFIRGYLKVYSENEMKPPVVEDQDWVPVFCLGFTRTGSTLFDKILKSHSEIVTLEEQKLVDGLIGLLPANILEDYPVRLTELEPNEILRLRKIYRREFTKLTGNQTGKVRVDKMPLNTIHIGLIHYIFPEARFLFTQRHPLDILVSNLFQDYISSDAMNNFLSLDSAINLYDKTMELWEIYQKQLSLNYYTVRYEELINNFETVTKEVTNFLGLEWEASMEKYQATAIEAKTSTPSYEQVILPLYSTSINRHEKYLPWLGDAEKRLSKWITQFGY